MEERREGRGGVKPELQSKREKPSEGRAPPHPSINDVKCDVCMKDENQTGES